MREQLKKSVNEAEEAERKLRSPALHDVFPVAEGKEKEQVLMRYSEE